MYHLYLYLSICIFGVLIYHFVIVSRLALYDGHQNIRNRMRYELRQDINNLITEFNRIDLTQQKDLFFGLQKIGASPYLANRHMDGAHHFIAHIESTLAEQTRYTLIRYHFEINPLVYQQKIGLRQRSDLIQLIHLLTKHWDNSRLLNISLEVNKNMIIMKVINADKEIQQIFIDKSIQFVDSTMSTVK